MFKIISNVAKSLVFDVIVDQAKDLIGISSPSKEEVKIIKEKEVIINNIIEKTIIQKQDCKEVIDFLNKENQVLYANLNKLRGRFTRSLITWLVVQTIVFFLFIEHIVQYFVLVPKIPFS
ncbi:MAG: hypothetical protein HOM96_03750 [Rickettsiales bacterium]|jgi:hypothetical protein|nr:hypothetical protein [Rickettsiales bacterium]